MSAVPVLARRLENAGGMCALAIASDGRLVAAGGGVTVDPMDRVHGFEPRVRLWDVASGALLRVLVTPHPSTARSSQVLVAFLPGSSSVLTTGDDGMIIEWEVASGRELRRFGGAGAITAFALSVDGETLVTGGSFEDARLRVWDVQSGRLVTTLEGAHDWSVSAIALTGSLVVSASSREVRGIRVHDRANGRELLRCAASGGYVAALSCLPGANRALTGGFARLARVWDLDSGKVLCAMKGKRDSDGAALLPGGRYALTTSSGALCVWNAENGALLHEVKAGCGAPLAVSRDGAHAVTLGTGAVLVWALR